MVHLQDLYLVVIKEVHRWQNIVLKHLCCCRQLLCSKLSVSHCCYSRCNLSNRMGLQIRQSECSILFLLGNKPKKVFFSYCMWSLNVYVGQSIVSPADLNCAANREAESANWSLDFLTKYSKSENSIHKNILMQPLLTEKSSKKQFLQVLNWSAIYLLSWGRTEYDGQSRVCAYWRRDGKLYFSSHGWNKRHNVVERTASCQIMYRTHS